MRPQVAQDPPDEDGHRVGSGGGRGVHDVAPLDLAAGHGVQPGARGPPFGGHAGQDGQDGGGGGAGIAELVVAVGEQTGGVEVVELADRVAERSPAEERLGHGGTGS